MRRLVYPNIYSSLVNIAIKANQYLESENGDFIAVSNRMKSDFVHELPQTLIETNERKIFNNCFDQQGNVLASGIEKLMAEQWSYIMDGTYGVCLKEISARNVILKKISVSILEGFLNASSHNKNLLEERAKYAAELYANVAGEFGPHEIAKSTRGRLFNKYMSRCNVDATTNTEQIV